MRNGDAALGNHGKHPLHGLLGVSVRVVTGRRGEMEGEGSR